ncbi:MAG: B12-binding domain-containing radical SAM protein [Methanosarcinales archaeon]
MKVLITSPPMIYWFLKFGTTEYPDIDAFKKDSMPPLSIYLLASILREKGHSVNLIDPMCHQIKFPNTNKIDINSKISNHDLFEFAKSVDYNYSEMQFPTLEKKINNVDAFCVSSTTLEWFVVKNMMERIKLNDPDIPIILGGVHATYVDEHILKNSKTDYVVRKEGEKTLVELLNALEKNKNLKEVLGISYKNNGKVIRNENRKPLTIKEMEETALPAFDLMPLNTHAYITVESSRGCKFSCAFCSIPFRNLWRGLSPEIVQKRVEHALNYTKKLIGEKIVFFVDDAFTASKKRAKQILHNLSEINFGDAHLKFEARANDLLDIDLIRCCTKIPLQNILIGVESGYDIGLKKIRKGTTTHNIEKCASLFKKYGISEHILYSFIIGFPWETKEDCLRTIDFAYKLVSEYGGSTLISWLYLLPGSYLWNNRSLYGIKQGPEIYDSIYWRSDEFRLKLVKLNKEDIIDIKKRAYGCRALSMLNDNMQFIFTDRCLVLEN